LQALFKYRLLTCKVNSPTVFTAGFCFIWGKYEILSTKLEATGKFEFRN
jgi:hypothetical protein